MTFGPRVARGSIGHKRCMTDTKKPKSPAEASRDGLRLLAGNRKKHDTTAHTPAQHANGAKFDETATEPYRGEPLEDKQK
jgi:hypothetical protein